MFWQKKKKRIQIFLTLKPKIRNIFIKFFSQTFLILKIWLETLVLKVINNVDFMLWVGSKKMFPYL